MTTARDIITSGLRKIHVLGRGQSLDSSEADSALGNLNDFMTYFSIEGCATFQSVKETFPLTSAASYTIVSGGDFDTTSPIEITAVYITIGDTDYTLREIGEKRYASLSEKDLEEYAPWYYYYDDNHPTPTIYLSGKPTSGTITIYSRKPLTAFATLDTDYDMPPEYKPLLIHNFAVWAAPEYQKEAPPTVMRIAEKTKTAVQNQNRKNNPLFSKIGDIPSRNGNTGDIYGGYWR